ncbi:hypothetical protein AXG93_4831s1490 [Marchantia polymorpha subsp. ruderalis]|uniref:Dirigent protein n=1 Tax=Marchantia polymorpha subsp. ruderalis TaxID=1480154 RepID=A0A176W8J1_MARPO|nr:hypothetical protein AXG93_4831s1490 [Marchantia polymorpha subsp. ruderalis]
MFDCTSVTSYFYLPAVCTVQAETVKLQFYEQVNSNDELLVFQAKDKSSNDGQMGNGYIYENSATLCSSPKCLALGTVSGWYYYTSEDTVEEVNTIKFSPTSLYPNAELHVRGVWVSASGKDLDTQELAIIGGTHGLDNAYGTLTFTKLNAITWRVEASFRL